MFNPLRLSQARKRRRLTAKGLAEAAGVVPLTIARLEKGEAQPEGETLERLAKTLEFPVAFFGSDDPEQLATDAVSFRSLSKMSVKERDAALAAGELALQVSDWVDRNFDLPEADLPDLGQETDPEAAAQALRSYWGLGARPIESMIALLEAKGVRIFSLEERNQSVDAFSFWRDERPFAFLNTMKTAERSRFDSAHELGHLVLHRHADSNKSREAESDADAFASAFLMPADDVRAQLAGRPLTLSRVLTAKKRWRVSAMALCYRAHKLGLLTEWQYKSLCIKLGKMGFRRGEPDGIERETSPVWRKVFSQLWIEKTTKEQVAHELGLPLQELQGLIVGVTDPSPVGEGRSHASPLRVVK